MYHNNKTKGWLKNTFRILLAGFILIFFGMSSIGVARAQEAAVRWEYLLDFNDPDPGNAARQADSLTPNLANNGVASKLLPLADSNYRLAMTGSEGLAQLRQVLYSPEMASFIGGVVKLEINMPVDSLEATTLSLESNLSTGYQWRFVSSEGVSFKQAGNPTFVSRSRGYGTMSLQTLVLQPKALGNASIKLEYRRSFQPAETATRQLKVNFAAQAVSIDLSNPNPKVITEKVSSDVTGSEDPIADIPPTRSLPTSWDWRTQGIVPAVRDQGSCGGCWSFGTVSVMESAVKKAGGPLLDLSEQFLISCNNDGWGCNGGLTATKYHYNTLAQNQTQIGAVLESDKPYTATNGSCTVALPHSYRASGWAFVAGSEWIVPTVDQIKSAIYTYGPVTAGVCADSGWDSYAGGVYAPSSNGCNGYTNHQIVLVGWNDADSTWILRNSWGPSWGDNGYMHIRWDANGTTSRVGEGTSWVTYGGASNVPTPQAPAGTITDRTPTYKWTKVTGATQYQYQLMQGTTAVYAKIVPASACTTTTCLNTPTNVLGYLTYKWRVRALVGGAWKPYSAFKNFTIKNPYVPTPKAPSGTIADTTPTYKWTKVNGATQYQYQLMRGTTAVYAKIVPASACTTTVCSNTPTTTLADAVYKWRVRANVGGAWKPFSVFKTFTVQAPQTGPQAGFWESTTGDEFWVTPDRAYVDEFAIYLTGGCGNIKITRTTPVAIVNNAFSFDGSFYASGTFDSATSAHGTDGLSNYYIFGCGTISAGPWDWTATWQYADLGLAGLEKSVEPILKLVSPPRYYHVIDKVVAP